MRGIPFSPRKSRAVSRTRRKNVSSDREIKLKRAFSLSDREVEIALMLYEGFTNRQISSALKISEGTTRNYISAIYVKTGSENRSGAVEAIKSVL